MLQNNQVFDPPPWVLTRKRSSARERRFHQAALKQNWLGRPPMHLYLQCIQYMPYEYYAG